MAGRLPDGQKLSWCLVLNDLVFVSNRNMGSFKILVSC
jgi:hypothetical protein